MLSSFTARNFRLFQQIDVFDLARVNLFVGRNNSGKSALLEALEVYASNGTLRTLFNLVTAREENWSGNLQRDIHGAYDTTIRHLFYGHSLPKVGESGICVGPVNRDVEGLNLLVAAYRLITDEEGDMQRIRLTANDLAEDKGDETDIEFTLISLENDRIRRILQLDSRSARRQAPARYVRDFEPRFPYQVVPTGNMAAKTVAALWDLIGLTDLAEEVVDGLRLIDPSIKGLAFVENMIAPGEARVPLVQATTSAEPLPLKSLGDGTTRLLHIILALVSAKDGILLIDEFETGLHWSVQAAVWKTIFRVAARLNVQVFATTHSRDCVAGFEEAWAESPDSAAFHRLQPQSNGCIGVRGYSLDTLADSLETDVEVR